MSKFIKLVEVSPRDGLQNEAKRVPTAIKIEFINLLSQTGLSVIEATSFVSPRWIPQLADGEAVFRGIDKIHSVAYPVLVPNRMGFDRAVAAGATEVSVFTTPSEQFSQHNTHCSVEESVQRIAEITSAAKKNKIRVRGYLSSVLGCPYQGKISPQSVAKLAEILLTLGCYEISLGDTIGIGTPKQVKYLIEVVAKKIPRRKIAVHFHDTYGQALTNIYVALEQGIRVIDSSVAGIGGCPYAKGASGNVASEEVLYLLNGLGYKTGVDLEKLILAGKFISDCLQQKPRSKVLGSVKQ